MADGVFTLDLNEPFPRLSRPPIVEAIIHWQARARLPLEPESLDTALTGRLSKYPTHEPIQQFALMAMVSGEAASPVVQHRKGWQGIRLKSDDGRYLVQLTRDGLAFSRTKGYEHWEPFRDAAKEAWRAYLDIADPPETQKLSVRFINHIAAATPETLRDFLREPPTCPSNLALKEFVYQSTFAVSGHPFGVRVIKVSQPPMPGQQQSSGLYLDIEVYSTTAIPNDLSELDNALERMRWLKNKVFFGLLTDAAIQSF